MHEGFFDFDNQREQRFPPVYRQPSARRAVSYDPRFARRSQRIPVSGYEEEDRDVERLLVVDLHEPARVALR